MHQKKINIIYWLAATEKVRTVSILTDHRDSKSQSLQPNRRPNNRPTNTTTTACITLQTTLQLRQLDNEIRIKEGVSFRRQHAFISNKTIAHLRKGVWWPNSRRSKYRWWKSRRGAKRSRYSSERQELNCEYWSDDQFDLAVERNCH